MNYKSLFKTIGLLGIAGYIACNTISPNVNIDNKRNIQPTIEEQTLEENVEETTKQNKQKKDPFEKLKKMYLQMEKQVELSNSQEYIQIPLDGDETYEELREIFINDCEDRCVYFRDGNMITKYNEKDNNTKIKYYDGNDCYEFGKDVDNPKKNLWIYVTTNKDGVMNGITWDGDLIVRECDE